MRCLGVCFSAATNFVGSGALGIIGGLTLTKVKHRRELLFAGLPMLPLLLPLGVTLFESGVKARKRMFPFVVIGGATMLWGLTACPFQVSVKAHSIVYIDAATNNNPIAAPYIIATCGSLFFSKLWRSSVLRLPRFGALMQRRLA